MNTSKNTEPDNLKLVALWAFAESGLGGLMHALKIPFTGIVLGGFSVIMLILLSQSFEVKKRPFLLFQYTLMVMLVKLIASPHSPAMAYIAVGFQGFAAWIFLGLMRSSKVTQLLFAVLAMLESATQKLLVTTFLYGKAFWDALDQFGSQVNKDFGFGKEHSLSFFLISIYLGIYFFWGILLPFWTARIQKGILSNQELLKAKIKELPELQQAGSRGKSALKKYLPFLITFAILGVLYLASWDKKQLLYIACRNLFALFVFVYLLGPLLNRLLQYWASKSSLKNNSDFLKVQTLLPAMKRNWELAQQVNQGSRKNFRYLIHTIETFVFLALMEDAEE